VRDFIVSATVLGGIMGTANLLNTYLAGVFSSVITFPVVNGGRILLTSVLVPFLFKEKTSRLQKTGIILGFIAILLIALA
jgi:drug/metabolite transporter (DMT)-like permease